MQVDIKKLDNEYKISFTNDYEDVFPIYMKNIPDFITDSYIGGIHSLYMMHFYVAILYSQTQKISLNSSQIKYPELQIGLNTCISLDQTNYLFPFRENKYTLHHYIIYIPVLVLVLKYIKLKTANKTETTRLEKMATTIDQHISKYFNKYSIFTNIENDSGNIHPHSLYHKLFNNELILFNKIINNEDPTGDIINAPYIFDSDVIYLTNRYRNITSLSSGLLNRKVHEEIKIKSNQGDSAEDVQEGGYKHKYLKYKQKYLLLKTNLLKNKNII